MTGAWHDTLRTSIGTDAVGGGPLVGYLSTSIGLAAAIAVVAAMAYAVFFIAGFCLPETRGRVLHADT